MKRKTLNLWLITALVAMILCCVGLVLSFRCTSSDKTIKELTTRAEAGDAQTQFKLGANYYLGQGVLQNHEKAVFWWKKAAKKNLPIAEFSLGKCYAEGDGVQKDETKAVELYQKAAEASVPYAQLELALAYVSGLGGMSKSPEKAFYWMTRSASQGYVRAELGLGSYYERGYGTPVDYIAAIEWYRKAAKQGNCDAQAIIGWLYMQGNGVKKDYSVALKCFREVLKKDKNNNFALEYLGLCYYNGFGVPQDYKRAAEFFQHAAKLGNVEAQFNLGVCYQMGHGVKQDNELGKKWKWKAFINGCKID